MSEKLRLIGEPANYRVYSSEGSVNPDGEFNDIKIVGDDIIVGRKVGDNPNGDDFEQRNLKEFDSIAELSTWFNFE